MNFNNINGVWPQIKDYIDSKLGGGVSKYKHMIYMPYLYIYDNMIPYVSSDTRENGSTDITKVVSLYKKNNRLLYYGNCSLLSIGPVYSDVLCIQSNYFLALKEGWYINCMGQIYDWKGNIVE